MTLYTFGYRGRRIEDLDADVERLRACVVDVRYSPFGRDHTWTRPGLQARYGPRYVWIREFGNKNYRGGPIELLDEERGARRLGAVIADGTPAILLCACATPAECHRTVIAEKLRAELGWEIVHLTKGRGPRQRGMFE